MPEHLVLLRALREIVGPRHVLTTRRATRAYRVAFRGEEGAALAVVRPETLVEQWRVLRSCVDAGVIVIMQAANTGLTGGSTPPPASACDRPIVVVSTDRICGIHVISGGDEVICLAGATLHRLEQTLRPYQREPHSVIGSSCIGASVVGGVCNNSGGALVRRGPAYTQHALYAQVCADGVLRLVNHLGIELGNDPEDILHRVQHGRFDRNATPPRTHSRPNGYSSIVRDITAATPARFNADARGLFEASGCAGKLAVFALRLDTFPAEEATTFYVGARDASALQRIRRHILTKFAELPISAEYMHRAAFDVAAAYGKDVASAISTLGAQRMSLVFKAKALLDDMFGAGVADRLLHLLSRVLPDRLPPRIRAMRDKCEHHLLLKVSRAGVAEARVYLSGITHKGDIAFFECTADEASQAFLHRFVVAGAAARYAAVHEKDVEGIISLDVALPRDAEIWDDVIPAEAASDVVRVLHYGHFLCHVFHRDYVIAKGASRSSVERALLSALDAQGAEYPAEHNVGRKYQAKPQLAAFYEAIDPTNAFNAGIGKTSSRKNWEREPTQRSVTVDVAS